jgi:hypothetical protein
MPSGERDVVQRLIDHWEVGEFAPALGHLHADVVVVKQFSGRGFEGHGGVRRLPVGRIVTRGKRTGGELDRPVALLFAVQDGLISRIDAFPKRLDGAYAAAGLERERPS